MAIFACASLFAAGCPLLACPKAEETLLLPEADASVDAGADPDGGIQEAAARCRASANDCLAYCRAVVANVVRCARVTADGGYAISVVHEVPCL
jgi:hypothetical protein